MKAFGTRSSGLPSKLLFLLMLLGAPAPSQLVAQDVRRECRCIDREGRTIENCTCIRTPDVSQFRVFAFAPRARIGVSLEESVEGARIAEVREGSPAAVAGLLAGDVITRVNGQSLREPLTDRARERRIREDGDVAVERLMALATEWEPGQAVELEYLRAGERRTLRVQPEATPADELGLLPGGGRVRVFGEPGARGLVFGPDGRLDVHVDSLMRGFRFDMDSLRVRSPMMLRPDSLARATLLRVSNGCFGARGTLVAFQSDCVDGVHLMELNSELGEYFGATRGVLVSSVEDGSQLGLRPGDVILSIGGRTVEEAAQARRILASYDEGDDVPLRIRRQGREMDVTGRRR